MFHLLHPYSFLSYCNNLTEDDKEIGKQATNLLCYLSLSINAHALNS